MGALPEETGDHGEVAVNGKLALLLSPLASGIAAAAVVSALQRRQRNAIEHGQACYATLNILLETLPYFRQGLNPQTAERAATLIRDRLGVKAVSIVDRERVLAFVGAGSDHHKPGQRYMTGLTWEVIQSGRIAIVDSKKEGIRCPVPDCPLSSALVVPLKVLGETVGASEVARVEAVHAIRPIGDERAEARAEQVDRLHASVGVHVEHQVLLDQPPPVGVVKAETIGHRRAPFDLSSARCLDVEPVGVGEPSDEPADGAIGMCFGHEPARQKHPEPNAIGQEQPHRREIPDRQGIQERGSDLPRFRPGDAMRLLRAHPCRTG